MRHVRFRAWDKKRKEMIPVYSINFETKLINMEYAWRMFKEVEIMQSTNKRDDKGNYIYEGDIVDNPYGYIEFYDDSNGFYITPINNNLTKIPLYRYGDRKINVIGNIYENKELLERI